MHSTWLSFAAGRRRILTGLVLALAVLAVSGTSVFAQQAPAAQAAPAQAPPSRVFTSDAGLMFNIVKADKTADFEMVIGKLKEALQKSENPVRKAQAASWKVFKQVEPGPNGNVLYVFVVSPTVKDADYTVSKILVEGFPPEEVQKLFAAYRDSLTGGVSMSNLTLVSDISK
jgi:hypothetical protein